MPLHMGLEHDFGVEGKRMAMMIRGRGVSSETHAAMLGISARSQQKLNDSLYFT